MSTNSSNLLNDVYNRLGKSGKTSLLYDLAMLDAEATTNSGLAQEEREWSEDMSNSSHLREVNDLISSGLNPVLSANQGANAYTGASASANAQSSNSARLQSNASKSVANINADTQKKTNANNMKIAKMNNKNQLVLAKIQQDTAKYSADVGANAMLGSAYQNFLATQYAADLGYKSSLGGLAIKAGTALIGGAKGLIKKRGAYYVNNANKFHT